MLESIQTSFRKFKRDNGINTNRMFNRSHVQKLHNKMENKTSSEVSFALRKIETKQFAFIEEAFTKDSQTSLNVKLRFSVNKEMRMIDSAAIVKFIANENVFLLIEISCFFEIKDTSWRNYITDDGKISVPKGILRHLAMHTVGTLRGVLHAKTENTDFYKYFLPPINVEAMISDDLLLE